jgi:hypothetical protein
MIGYIVLLLFGLILIFCAYFVGVCLIAASQECVLPGIEDIEA